MGGAGTVLRVLLLAGGMAIAMAGSPAAAQEDGAASYALVPEAASPLPTALTSAAAPGYHTGMVTPRGELTLRFVDVSIPARGWPIVLSRNYASGAENTGFGTGWTWSMGVRLSVQRDTGTLIVLEPNGSESAYQRAGEGEFVAAAGRLSSRIYALPEGYKRIFADGSWESFDSDGRLVRRTGIDGAGYRIEWLDDGSPGAVVHDDGQRVTFTSIDGRISAFSDELGRVWSFGYDAGVLASVTNPAGGVTTFTPDEKGRLADVTLVDGEGIAVAYDVNDRVSELAGPGSLNTQFEHWGRPDDGSIVQTMIDANGLRYRLEIHRDPVSQHFSIVSIDPGGVETVRDFRGGSLDVAVNGAWIGGLLNDSASRTTTLLDGGGVSLLLPPGTEAVPPPMAMPDARGLPLLVAAGGVTYWQNYDAVGRVIGRMGPTGAIERFTLDVLDRVIAVSVDGEPVLTFEYDAAGRLLRWEHADGSWIGYGYSPEGQVARIAGTGMEPQTVTYDAGGRIIEMNDGVSVWTARFDSSGRAAGLVNQSGQSLTIAYDETGYPISVTDTLGLVTYMPKPGENVVTDSLGRKRGVVTDAEGTTFEIGPWGSATTTLETADGQFVTETVGADGATWTVRTDAEGALLAAEGTGGRPVFVDTDEDGRITQLGDPRHPSVLVYDENGLLAKRIGPTGLATVMTHDERGYLTQVASPLDSVKLDYDEDGRVIALDRHNGETLDRELDAQGRPVRLTSTGPLGDVHVETLSYDELGRVVEQQLDGVTRRYSYGVNETTITIQSEGVSQTWVERYDPDTHTTTVTAPDGTQSTIAYDAAGRMVAAHSARSTIALDLDPDGAVVSMTVDGQLYDATGGPMGGPVLSDTFVVEGPDGVARAKRVADLRGAEWELGYDYRNLLVRITDPLGGVTNITRNALGNVTARIDPEGRAYVIDYDELGRPVTSGVAGGWAVANAWDGKRPIGTSFSGGASFWTETILDERLVVANSDQGEIGRFTFDALGRVSVAASDLGSIGFTYGAAGQIASQTDVFGRTVTYRYDGLGRLVAMVLPEGDELTFDYVDGNTTSQTGPDGLTTTAHYDSTDGAFDVALADGGELQVDLVGGGAIGGYKVTASNDSALVDIERDAAKTVSALVIDGVRQEVTLDPLNRTIGYSSGEGEAAEWAYDGSGNIVSAPDGKTRVYDEAYRLTQFGDAQASYDADGRLVELDGNSFAYDGAGRLIRAETADGLVTTLVYDVMGRLVERRTGAEVERYLYAGGQLLAVYDGTGKRLALIERNRDVPGLVRVHTPEGVTGLIPNHLGTPSMTLVDGKLSRLAPYGVWGKAPADRAKFGRWVGFTGALELPEHGLVLFNHRAYAPALQRFLTPDPLGMEGSTNPYAYADLQPLGLVDAGGRKAVEFGVGPKQVGPSAMQGFGTPTSIISLDSGDLNRYDNAVKILESIAGGTPGPAQQVAKQTLDVLNQGGIRVEVRGVSTKGTLGLYGSGKLKIFVYNIDAAIRKKFPKATPDDIARAIAGVLVHEATHAIQSGSPSVLDRTYKEYEATLRQGLFEAPDAGFLRGDGTPIGKIRNSFNYAAKTQWDSYRSAPPYGGPHLQGGHAAGLFQLDERSVVDLTKRYHPNLSDAAILRTFRDTHSGGLNAYLKAPGDFNPQEVTRKTPDALADMIARARIAEQVALRPEVPAYPSPLPKLPQPVAAPPHTSAPNKPTIEPLKPAAELPRPNPTIEYPRAPATGVQASGADPFDPDRTDLPASKRPIVERPIAPERHAGTPEVRPTAEVPRPGRPVAPVPERPVTPVTHDAHTSGAPERPVVPERPVRPAPDPDGPRPVDPNTPRPVDPGPAPRPVDRPAPYGVDAPHPSRTRVHLHAPDLSIGGARPPKPPHSLPSGGPDRAHMPHGAGGRSGASRKFFAALDVLGGAFDVYSTLTDIDDYWSGKISTKEFLTRAALTACGWLPWPISGAVMAHQIGGFIGGWLANSLLQEAANGDKVAQHILEWLRRSGWINANDPTFVAVAEAMPPDLSMRRFMVTTGAAPSLSFAAWSATDRSLSVRLVSASGETAMAAEPVVLVPGSNRIVIPAGTVSALAVGEYLLVTGDELLGTIEVLEADRSPTPSGRDEVIDIDIDVRDIRLEPTALPWTRFDRQDALLSGPEAGRDELGDWVWSVDDTAPGSGDVHANDPLGTQMHYLLLPSPRDVVIGDNIIQYIWVDPEAPPSQILLQYYDEALSGAHRLSLGEDLIIIDDRAGSGFIEGGGIPEVGKWLRIRIPVADLDLDGRKITGLGFAVEGGHVRFGPTAMSGSEDSSPLIVAVSERDESGAPQADVVVRVTAASAGRLQLDLIESGGVRAVLFDGDVNPGRRAFWWQGDATDLTGARFEAVLTPDTGEAVAATGEVAGNPALVAQLLYPPVGAVVRQTVPIFGQAGGAGFDHYLVEYRVLGDDEAEWTPIARGEAASVSTGEGVEERIEAIMSQQLRGTVHGNLASLHTGSALHDFPFAEADPVLPSGILEIRLTSVDGDGDSATDTTIVRLGEVVTGQQRSIIPSPDGLARLEVPPLSLPTGIGALSIDREVQSLPADAPAADSAVYGIAPGGLDFSAPVQVGVRSASARSIVVIGAAGDWRQLPGRRKGDWLIASVSSDPGERYYASPVPVAEATANEPDAPGAPWFADAQGAGLLAAHGELAGETVLIDRSVPIDGPLALILGYSASDIDGVALVLRYAGDAMVVPLGQAIPGLRQGFATPPLGLEAGDRLAALIRLDRLVPDGIAEIDRIDLVRINSAAWRTYRADPLPPGAFTVHAASIGTMPETGGAARWRLPEDAKWRFAGEATWRDSPANVEIEGWHWIEMSLANTVSAWPVLRDTTAPSITAISPAPESTEGILRMMADLGDAGAGVAGKTIAASLNGVDLPAGEIAFDPVTGDVEIAFGRVASVAGIVDGARVTARLEVEDRLGQTTSPPAEWSWTYRAEPQTIGALRQLSLNGGQYPAWRSGGGSLVFAAPIDGQADLFEMPASGGTAVRLTDTAEIESAPAPHPETDAIAFLRDDALILLSDGTQRILTTDVTDPSWLDGDTLLAGRGNMVVSISVPDGAETVLCTAAVGSSVSFPRVVGAAIAFTQAIYHRTLWLCDPRTGALSPISNDIDDPGTAEIEGTADGDNALIYALDDGRSGLWRASLGSSAREPLTDAADGSSDRRPALSPDGRTLLFESDRTGRPEIWRMDLPTDIRLLANPSTIGTGSAIPLSLTLDAPGGITVANWRLLDRSGRPVNDAIEVALPPGGSAYNWTVPAGLPSGQYIIEARLSNDVAARAPLSLDGTAPSISVTRLGDGASVDAATALLTTDRLVVGATDGEQAVLDVTYALGDVTPQRVMEPIALDKAAAPIALRVFASDVAGNTTEFVLPLNLPEPVAVHETPPEPDTLRTWLVWTVLIGTIMAAGAMLVMWRHRKGWS